mgnify:CR=1 FL=1
MHIQRNPLEYLSSYIVAHATMFKHRTKKEAYT